MKRITLIILAVAAVLAGSVSCQKANDIDNNPLSAVALSIIPDFSDGSVYSYSDDGSFLLSVSVTPAKYIDKLLNNDALICKADFRSVITKAVPENLDFTVVGEIASASVEEGYMTASFTLTEDEMGKMLEADYMVSFSTEDADGVHGASTAFVFVSWCARDGRGGNIVDFDGHKAVRLAGLYWATEDINDYASCERFHGRSIADMLFFFNQLNEKTGNYNSSNNNALNAARSWGGSWTLPSKENWQDLIDYCKWTSLEEGWLVEGKSEYGEDGNSIFLPFPGSDYWAKDMYCLSRIPDVSTAPASKYLSVRPVVRGITSVVFGITMNSPSIVVEMGATSTLTVNVSPSSSFFAVGSNRMFQWSSSNPDVASVDIYGKVTGVYAGEATITAKFREFTATCEVTVFSNAVDLGLSVKWASMNLGANAPEKSGDYYAWGATTTNPGGNYSWSNCPYCIGGYGEKFNKYVPMWKRDYWGGGGNPDHKRELEPGDDAATARLGGKWRTPTSAEFEELFKSCDTEWTTVNNVNGLKFTSRTNGNSIFLPAAGYRNGYSLNGAGEEGYYMSSSLATDIPDHSECLKLSSTGARGATVKRNIGLTIRAVTE